MKRCVIVFLLAALAAPLTFAQAPESFGAVAPAIQAFVDRREIAGVVTMLATTDRILHTAAAGTTALGTTRQMRTDDIFWIASMTKPVTAVAIAILADEGKLSFDDPLGKYLPEFAAGSTPFTLRQMLTHTSGLGELGEREPHITLGETSRLIAKLPLRFQPGARWGYSTAAFDVLGRVVEVASGMPFDRFLQSRLFDPLGMKDTRFWVRDAEMARWAQPYQWVAAEKALRATLIPYLYLTQVNDYSRPPLGGAGLFSTAADVARFYQMMLNGGTGNGQRILKRETAAEMIRKQTGDLTARPGMPWGLGFSVVENPAAMEANRVLSPGSFGHGGAFSTQSWADPAKGWIWIVMFQRTGKGNPDNSDVRIAFQNAVAPPGP